MNKIEIKKELEEMILSTMLNDPESVPVISQKIKQEDLSKDNDSLFEKILALSIADPVMRVLDLSKENIPGWDLASLSNLSKYNSYEQLVYNKVIEKFYDINFSLKVDSFLQKTLKKNENAINGFDTLVDLQVEIEQLIKKTENFIEDRNFSDKVPDIFIEIENELSSKNSNSYTVNNIPSFNSSTGGIRPSNLIGIAGSFKSGKTTLVSNFLLLLT